MNVKKYIIISLVCGLVALLLFFGVWRNNKSVNVSLQKKDSTITTNQEKSMRGAIARARELYSMGYSALKDEALQFGLNLSPSDVKNYKYIRDRLFANEKLASVFRAAKKQGVSIYLKQEFEVITGGVYVDVKATDQEIIDFINASLPEANAKQIAYDKVKAEASQFGLILLLSDVKNYKYIRDRLFANEKLASAFRVAKKQGVYIYLRQSFKIEIDMVYIDVRATDQEIIDFLLKE